MDTSDRAQTNSDGKPVFYSPTLNIRTLAPQPQTEAMHGKNFFFLITGQVLCPGLLCWQKTDNKSVNHDKLW